MAKEVIVTADKISKWQKFGKIIKISLLILLLFLIIIYLVLKVTYHGGSFVVNLKPKESIDSSLTM